jgi:hypothetical protein
MLGFTVRPRQADACALRYIVDAQEYEIEPARANATLRHLDA